VNGKSILIFFLLILSVRIIAQSESLPDSLITTPFRKGINLVGISGFVSSSDFGESSVIANTAQIGNSYRFDVRLGKFVANKNLVGLLFFTNRVNLVGAIESSADVTSLGPFYRLYIGKKTDIALILQASALWANYVSNSVGIISSNVLNQSVEAGGINGALGLGVTYVMAKRVTFEVTSEYSMARYWGRLSDHELDSESDITLSQSGLRFSFGFTVLFGKLKENE